MSERVSEGVERGCDWWGSSVSSHPVRAVLLALLLATACALGLFNLKQEERIYKLWYPQDSDLVQVSQNQTW